MAKKDTTTKPAAKPESKEEYLQSSVLECWIPGAACNKSTDTKNDREYLTTGTGPKDKANVKVK